MLCGGDRLSEYRCRRRCFNPEYHKRLARRDFRRQFFGSGTLDSKRFGSEWRDANRYRQYHGDGYIDLVVWHDDGGGQDGGGGGSQWNDLRDRRLQGLGADAGERRDDRLYGNAVPFRTGREARSASSTIWQPASSTSPVRGTSNETTPAPNAFNNAGTFAKSGEGTTTSFSDVAFNSTGSTVVESGMLSFASGGTASGKLRCGLRCDTRLLRRDVRS